MMKDSRKGEIKQSFSEGGLKMIALTTSQLASA